MKIEEAVERRRKLGTRIVATIGGAVLTAALLAGCGDKTTVACDQVDTIQDMDSSTVWNYAVRAGNGNLNDDEIHALEAYIEALNGHPHDSNLEAGSDVTVPAPGSCHFSS